MSSAARGWPLVHHSEIMTDIPPTPGTLSSSSLLLSDISMAAAAMRWRVVGLNKGAYIDSTALRLGLFVDVYIRRGYQSPSIA